MPPPCSGAGPGESRTVPQCNGQCRSGQRSHRRGGPTPTSSRGRFLMQGRDLSRPGTRHSGGSRNPGSCAALRSVWIAAYAAMTGAGGRCAVPAGDARLRRDRLSPTAGSSNGRTRDFESRSRGSSPRPAAPPATFCTHTSPPARSPSFPQKRESTSPRRSGGTIGGPELLPFPLHLHPPLPQPLSTTMRTVPICVIL